MPDLTLIERLESAAEGNRALSDECLLAVGVKLIKEPDDEYSYIARGLDDDGGPWEPAPHVTGNVQDALDWMVPEGWSGTVSFGALDERPEAELWNGKFYPEGSELFSSAATPALALCIASLKAIEARVAPREG